MRRRRPLLELKVVEIKGYSKKDGATSLRVSDNHGLVEVTAPDLKRCALHPCRAEPRVRKRCGPLSTETQTDVTAAPHRCVSTAASALCGGAEGVGRALQLPEVRRRPRAALPRE
jgi:hypothetical protein